MAKLRLKISALVGALVICFSSTLIAASASYIPEGVNNTPYGKFTANNSHITMYDGGMVKRCSSTSLAPANVYFYSYIKAGTNIRHKNGYGYKVTYGWQSYNNYVYSSNNFQNSVLVHSDYKANMGGKYYYVRRNTIE